MKIRNVVLAVALSMPVSAQAATLTIPEIHSFIAHPTAGGGFCFCSAGAGTNITQNHFNEQTGFLEPISTQSLFAGADGTFTFVRDDAGQLVPVFGGPRLSNIVSSAIFVVFDDRDFFTFMNNSLSSGGINVSLNIVHTIETPVPAALPLFTAGLGMVAFVARRRKRVA